MVGEIKERSEIAGLFASTLQRQIAKLAGHGWDGADCLPPTKLFFNSKGILIMKRLMILALGGACLAAPLYAALPEGAAGS